VAIIEDAAHALGSVYDNGKRVGSSGNIVCFSFYANKNVSTADGGAIALFDSEKAEHLRCLRMSGLESNAWSRYTKPSTISVAGIVELGYKMNFTDLQAAIGRVQLSRLDEMSLKRRSVATRYQELLHDRFPFQSGVFDEGHARHLLVARFDPAITGISRNDLLRNLRSRNVGASLHYTPLHQQPLYCQPDFTPLPVTDFLAAQIMTLPINAKMKLEDVDYVAEQLMLLLENPKRSTLTSADSIVG
jgi:dTDP-4-amino-4,6-dideoxygalactose transaminase